MASRRFLGALIGVTVLGPGKAVLVMADCAFLTVASKGASFAGLLEESEADEPEPEGDDEQAPRRTTETMPARTADPNFIPTRIRHTDASRVEEVDQYNCLTDFSVSCA